MPLPACLERHRINQVCLRVRRRVEHGRGAWLRRRGGLQDCGADHKDVNAEYVQPHLDDARRKLAAKIRLITRDYAASTSPGIPRLHSVTHKVSGPVGDAVMVTSS